MWYIIHFLDNIISLYFQSDVPYPLFLQFLLPFLLLLPIAKISAHHHGSCLPFLWLCAERQRKLFSLCHSLKYALCSPQLYILLLRIYISSGLQHHHWVHVCLLARNCLYFDCQLHSGEVRAFWSLLCLFCLENYRRKVLRQSGLIHSICFLSCSIIASLTLIIHS